MPFGLNIAPKVFTKLVAKVLRELRSRGVQIAAYLDDWIVWASSPDECLAMAKITIEFLEELSFRMNVKKSRLVPAQSFQWLGLQWDLVSHKLSIPPQKRKAIAKLVRSFLKRSRASRRLQERVLGSLLFAAICDPLLKVKLKSVNRVWRHRARPSFRDRVSTIPRRLKSMLTPFTTAASLSKSVPLCPPDPSVVIHTDASLSGWGGHSEDRQVQGTWSPTFQSFHINVLEAMAVFLTLRKLSPKQGSHIRLVLDSRVVQSCINRRGSRSAPINHVMIALFKLAVKKHWHLSATHLEGVRNVLADSLSRAAPLESEWTLDKASFQFVLGKVPDLQVDLFATALNHRLPLYVSPNVDSRATAMDAMTLDWNRWEKIYLFPPVNLLLKVLDKLRSYKGTAALVAPDWPQSSWYPLTLELKLKKFKLPAPVLSQVVQKKRVYASSWITTNLHLMVFSPMPIS